MNPPAPFTDDAMLDGRVIVRQPRDGYRAAIDPVLLAAFLRAPAGAVLDAGCGSGAALFCAAARLGRATRFTGLELQPALAAYATDGIGLNHLEGRAQIVCGDLADPRAAPGPFDAVITNPPYLADGTQPPAAQRALAHHEGAGLAAWLAACLARLKANGRLVLIHRADRLSEVLAALADAGDIRLLPIYPRAGEPARRVLLDAGKGRRSPDTLLPGLVLHEADGRFTPAAAAVLREAAPLA